MCTDTYKILANTLSSSPQGYDDSYRCVGENHDKQYSYRNIFTGVSEALGCNPASTNSITVRSYFDEEKGRVDLNTPVKISKADVQNYVKEHLL